MEIDGHKRKGNKNEELGSFMERCRRGEAICLLVGVVAFGEQMAVGLEEGRVPVLATLHKSHGFSPPRGSRLAAQ